MDPKTDREITVRLSADDSLPRLLAGVRCQQLRLVPTGDNAFTIQVMQTRDEAHTPLLLPDALPPGASTGAL